MVSSSHIRAALLVALVSVVTSPAWAADNAPLPTAGAAAANVGEAPGSRAGDSLIAPPPNFKAGDVSVGESLGKSVPVEAELRDLDGKTVTLGAVLDGEIPTILTFNYSNCPNLCSLQLNSLVTSLTDVPWKVGKQFRIVTILLDPSETLQGATATRDRYIATLPPGSDPAGWTFLLAPVQQAKPGDDATVRRIADSVGFNYTFMAETGDYAHPAAITFLGTNGQVTRYMYGAQFESKDVSDSIIKAGLNTPASALGFMYRCFHWDPTANSHAAAGASTLRYSAAIFGGLLISILVILHTMRRNRTVTPGAVKP